MPTIWIAVSLSAFTFGGAFAVLEMSGVMGHLVKALYAVTVLGLAAYLITHDGEDGIDEFANPIGPGATPALDGRSNA